MRFAFISLVLATLLSSPAHADGQCVAAHAFKGGHQNGARETKPSELTLGFTMTARGCLEICSNHRKQRAAEGRKWFRKMEYSCSYGGKNINKTTQTLY